MGINRLILQHLLDTPLRQGELSAIVESSHVPSPRDLTFEIVSKTWESVQRDRVERGLPPNLDLPRYYLNRIEGNRFFLSLGNYSLFLATNQNFLARRNSGTLGDDILEDYLKTGFSILGLAVVITSAEGAILIQKRSSAVLQGQGTYLVPAGGFMPCHYSPGEASPDPFVSAHHQLFSEQGVSANLSYVGISSDTVESANPSMVFYGETGLKIPELEAKWRRAKDNYESDFVRFISSGEEDMLRTIRGETTDFSGYPIADTNFLAAGLGALMLYGRAMFGGYWFSRSIAELGRNRAAGIDEFTLKIFRNS